VLCTSGGLYGSKVLQRLSGSADVQLVGIVVSTRVMHPECGWLQGVRELLRRSGPAYALYLGCATSLADALARFGGSRSVTASARHGRLPVLHTRDVNGLAGRSFVAGLAPDLLVSAFFNQRIGLELVRHAGAGAVNIHPSLLPGFRGVDPVFFQRLRGSRQFGVTLHRLDAEFDTGPVIAAETVPIDPRASVVDATARLFWHGAGLLLDSLPRLLDGDSGRCQPPGGGYDSWPTPAQVAEFGALGHRLVRLADLGLLRRGAPR
jgi:methionyl-tRNA formyltransferase